MNIAICEDESAQAQVLSLNVQQWARERKVAATITQYPNADSFLFAEGSSCDVLLLDIQMPGINGMELARLIRRNDDRIAIVFVTGYADYIAEGYDVDALHYLMKPVSKGKLFDVLDRAVERLNRAPQTILLNIDGEAVRLKHSEITYTEAVAHYVVIHTGTADYRARMRLSDLEAKLGVEFFRCHRSFLVGMKHVRRIAREAMVLTNGVEVPLSRKLFHAANRAFIVCN